AKAAIAAGVRIYEQSTAIRLDRGGKLRVATKNGAVAARHVVLAGDALLEGLEHRVNDRIMPVANYVVATEPLAGARALIPSDAAVSDTRF
ncbi:FAD-dependent oxidoreductase, partial [Pseudomonas sp. FW306-02-F02-AB]|uniref:FAD-dependent oxidoreductase n=1 Tax=Pseudomonas sp. FW306-02-F02-AB TaxID=2070653 RepID=UPI000CAC72A9